MKVNLLYSKITVLPLLCVAIALACVAFSSSCSGTKSTPIVADQSTGRGSVLLFKQAIDSNDIRGAVKVLAHPSGRLFLAIETVDVMDDVSRLQRLIGNKPMNLLLNKSMSDSVQTFATEFGYLKKIAFTSTKIDGKWYITSIVE